MKFKIPTSWSVSKTFIVEADSMEDAIDKVCCNENDKYPIKGGEYVDDSFIVDEDCCEVINDQ